jgi:hypothetical protein
MQSGISFRSSALAPRRVLPFTLPVALLALLLVHSPLFPAQAAPASTSGGMIGSIEGTDVSVEGPSAPDNSNETITHSILVGNGSVVTVHSGQAHMALATGGEVDICGPAKFTILQSGGAVTLAVELGRLRVQLPADASFRLFTPTVVATPLDISGGARDITVGLDQDDSLCVLATSGAIQLEHQFSGEKLIVPQSGEFFLNAGKLLPVVGRPGSCQCAAMQQRPTIQPATQPPEFAAAPLTAPPPPPNPQPAPAPASAAPPNVEFSIPAHANEGHPIAPSEYNASPLAPPAAPVPVYTVVAPPLTFSASAPAPPPDPPVDTILLVREAQVLPGWEFKGHVDAPTFAAAMQHALGEGSAPNQPPSEPRKKRAGFRGFLRRIFEGNGSQD